MHVLQVNKFLFGGAGAETVLLRTTDLLRAHGHEVTFFAMHDPRNLACPESQYFPQGRYYDRDQKLRSRVGSAISAIYSRDARISLRRLLRHYQPDVAHLHNIYHQLTLSVIDELAAHGVPMVMTMHDYKAVCPNYLTFTEGSPCRRCVTGSPGHAIVHRCIKDSRAASAIGTLEAVITRKRETYRQVQAFVAPSRHAASVMVEGGLPSERIEVIPHFLGDDQFAAHRRDATTARPIVAYVGRLEQAKGIRVLLAAARMTSDVEFAIAGGGPLQAEVEAAARAGLVRYLGQRPWRDIADLMDQSRAVVIPSLVEETFGLVALEAGARGCTVIGSDRGGLPEIIEHGVDGFVSRAGDAEALAHLIRTLADDAKLAETMGRARLERVRSSFTPAAHYEKLMGVYTRVSGATRTATGPTSGA